MLAATGGPHCAAFDGKLSSKACPQGFSQVTTEAACQSLTAIGGKSYGGSVTVATFPSGCFWLRVGGGVYLNTHSDGNANPDAQPLCAGAPPSRAATHASHPRTRTRRVRVGACAPALRLAAGTTATAGPSATAPTLSPPGGTAARRSASLHGAWPAPWPHAPCCAYLRHVPCRVVVSGVPRSIRDWQHRQQRLPAKLFSARDRGGMQEPGGHRGREYGCQQSGVQILPRWVLPAHSHWQVLLEHARERREKLVRAAAVRRCARNAAMRAKGMRR
jgi:hypothetical protein